MALGATKAQWLQPSHVGIMESSIPRRLQAKPQASLRIQKLHCQYTETGALKHFGPGPSKPSPDVSNPPRLGAQ